MSPVIGRGPSGSCILVITAEVEEDSLAFPCQDPSIECRRTEVGFDIGALPLHWHKGGRLSWITGWQIFVGVLYKNLSAYASLSCGVL